MAGARRQESVPVSMTALLKVSLWTIAAQRRGSVKVWARPENDSAEAITIKGPDGGHVRNKAAHIAVGVDMVGVKHVLGIWIQRAKGAEFWASVCAELASRGVRDVLIVCVKGSPGSPKRSRRPGRNRWRKPAWSTSSATRCGLSRTGNARPSPPRSSRSTKPRPRMPPWPRWRGSKSPSWGGRTRGRRRCSRMRRSGSRPAIGMPVGCSLKPPGIIVLAITSALSCKSVADEGVGLGELVPAESAGRDADSGCDLRAG